MDSKITEEMNRLWKQLDVPISKMFRSEMMTGEEIQKITDMHDNHLDPTVIGKLYLVLFHHNLIIDIMTDEIREAEPNFERDLSSLPDMLERIYLLGYWDGMGKKISKVEKKVNKKKRVKA